MRSKPQIFRSFALMRRVCSERLPSLPRMRATLLLAGIILLSLARPSALRSEVIAGEGVLARIASVALEDDAGANLVNPAGLGWATRRDLYLVLSEIRFQAPSAAGQIGTPLYAKERRRLLGAGFQFRRMGISYERVDNGARNRTDQWTLGLSQSLNRRLRLGYNLSRLRCGDDSAWRFRLGLLARPHDALSAGCTISDLFQSRLGDSLLPRTYRAAVGLRPLPGALRERMTFFAEIAGNEKERWRDKAGLTAGIRLEPLAGIELSAAASNRLGDFDNDPEYRVGLSVQFLTSRIEGAFRWHAEDDTTRSSSGAVHLLGDRPRTLKHKLVFAALKLRGALADESKTGLPLPIPFFGGGSRTAVASTMKELTRASAEPDVRGVLLKIGRLSGGAHLDEIRSKLAALRAQGKPVIAYIEEGGSHNGYGVAAACDGIVLAPGSALYLLGLRSDILYYGEMLDSLGIGMERISSGEFKTAYERYARDSASPGFREQIESLYDDHWERWVEWVAAGRGLTPEKVRELADGRVLRAEEAQSAGLVDSIGTEECARHWLEELAAVDAGQAPFTRTAGWRYRRYAWGPKPIIAVYYMNGFVSVGESKRPLFGTKTMGAETVRRDLERLANDSRVKAVVLRVESGGGLGLGGTLIRRAVQDLKASGKPVVVSMGRVAASAAYHFSAAADYLMASEGTYTGSIGVILVRPDMAGLLDRLGIHAETVERGDRMGLWTRVRPLTEEEREMAQRWVRDEYDEFLAHVARDRGMEPDSVRAVAQGRVWTGRQALARGLIDEIGGLDAAIEAAGRMAGLSKAPEVVSLHRPARRSLWHMAGRLLLGGLFAAQNPASEESYPGILPGAAYEAEFQLGIPSAFPREMGRSILPLEITPLGDLSLDD